MAKFDGKYSIRAARPRDFQENKGSEELSSDIGLLYQTRVRTTPDEYQTNRTFCL